MKLLLVLVVIVTLGHASDEEYTHCKDGDMIPASYVCDDYCDCIACDDEEECEGGIGITKIEIGGVEANLNVNNDIVKAKIHLEHDGGEYGVMTHHIPLFIWYAPQYAVSWLYHCIFEGDCSY